MTTITKQDVEACLLLMSAMNAENPPQRCQGGHHLTEQWNLIWDELCSTGPAYTFAHYLEKAAQQLVPPRGSFTLKHFKRVTETALHLLDHLPLPDERK